MDNISKLLKYVQKTNPSMTKERLIEELKKNRYSSVSLFMAWENQKK